MEAELVDIRAPDGPNSGVGTDEIAHAAADTGMGRIGPLIDVVRDRKDIARFLRKADYSLDDAFTVNAQLDGPDRTHGGTTAAEDASILIPDDLPGEVTFAQGRGAYLSH
jgi:hypothetical protein